MFEVVLRQDYEDIFFFREFEVNGVTNNTPNGQFDARLSPFPKSPRKDGRSSSGRSPHTNKSFSNVMMNEDGTKLIYTSP